MQEFDFSQPQRQSTAGILLIAGKSIFTVLKQVLLPLIFVIVKLKVQTLLYFGLGTLAILIFAAVYAYFYYLRFTFYLDSEKNEFIVNKGVFNKSVITIPLEKILHVNINQTLFRRIIGVYSVEIDTPGNEKKEANISAVSEEIAYALKAHLLEERASETKIEASGEGVSETTTEPTFIAIDTATLIKIGLTSNYGSTFGLLLGFIVTIIHQLSEINRKFELYEDGFRNVAKEGFQLATIVIFAIVLVALVLIINLVRTLIKYYDFKLSKHQNALQITSGMLARKNTLLTLPKIQIIETSQNYLQRKLGLTNIKLMQAKAGQQANNKEVKENHLFVPGCNDTEKDQLLQLILDKLPHKENPFIPNWRFLNLPILFRVLLPLLIYLIFYVFVADVRAFLPVAILYAVTVPLFIYIAYKKHRLFVADEHIVKQQGIWDISNSIIKPTDIQYITTFQYPWHRSLDVGHVDLYTSAGRLRFKYGNYTEIKILVNFWLYQIERD